MTQGTHTGVLYKLEGRDGAGDGREAQEGRDMVYLWLIHVEV